ncbi:unnamed protein product [Prorocentrum cordatum]|uniref:EF-hand domain-containing protein n=1 Tax=Prorocentrum cordatum TaxID=2364126 RepID=A0ABN9TMS7_9DINO|nr:unnamed protein product [Polarella glacialis]
MLPASRAGHVAAPPGADGGAPAEGLSHAALHARGFAPPPPLAAPGRLEPSEPLAEAALADIDAMVQRHRQELHGRLRLLLGRGHGPPPSAGAGGAGRASRLAPPGPQGLAAPLRFSFREVSRRPSLCSDGSGGSAPAPKPSTPGAPTLCVPPPRPPEEPAWCARQVAGSSDLRASREQHFGRRGAELRGEAPREQHFGRRLGHGSAAALLQDRTPSLRWMRSTHSSDADSVMKGMCTDVVKRSQTRHMWAKTRDLSRRPLNKWQKKLSAITSDWKYESLVSVLISLNALIIAWETDITADRASRGVQLRNKAFDAPMYFFCVVFAVDLSMRLFAERERFLFSPCWRWNLFDTLVVLGAIVEAFATIASECSGSEGNVLWVQSAVLRISRLIRLTKVVRTLRHLIVFRDMRIMAVSLRESIVPLMSFIVILCVFLLVVATVFTNATASHMLDHGLVDNALTGELEERYGSLFRSVRTLFMAIAGGVDWEIVVIPLEPLSIVYTLLFYAFIAFAMFAMLNVEFMNTMEQLFDEIDNDRSGQISLSELREKIKAPKVIAFLQALKMDVKQVKKLFNLIDTDKSGAIDKQEFMVGCTSLRGEAMQLDVAILQWETRSLKELVMRLADHLDDCFDRLAYGGANLPHGELGKPAAPADKEESPRRRRRASAPPPPGAGASASPRRPCSRSWRSAGRPPARVTASIPRRHP